MEPKSKYKIHICLISYVPNTQSMKVVLNIFSMSVLLETYHMRLTMEFSTCDIISTLKTALVL